MVATVYDHIEQNNRNTVFLILMFPACLAVIIYILLFAALALTGEPSIIADGLYLAEMLHINPLDMNAESVEIVPAAAVASMGITLMAVVPIFCFTSLWMLIAYLSGDKMILRASDAAAVSKPDNPEVYRLVENVAIAAGLPCPKLYIIKDDSLNAFATGRNPENASITLTTGILAKLNRQELEAVIAHEMGHIGNRDIRLMLLIIIGIGAMSFLTDVMFRSLNSFSYTQGRRDKNSGGFMIVLLVIALALMIFSLLVAPILRFALSRSREYAADTTSALITRNPGALANALQKISEDSRVEVLDKMPTVGALCIANPLGKGRKRLFDWVSGLYATHPPIAKRIAALREMDGQAG